MQPVPPPKKKVVERYLRTDAVPAYFYSLTQSRVPTRQTVRNWMRNGKIGNNGEIVKLQYIIRRGAFLTKKTWIRKFVGELYGESL